MLKLKRDEPLSNLAFKFNLCRYILEELVRKYRTIAPLLGKVGRCRLTLSNPS